MHVTKLFIIQSLFDVQVDWYTIITITISCMNELFDNRNVCMHENGDLNSLKFGKLLQFINLHAINQFTCMNSLACTFTSATTKYA